MDHASKGLNENKWVRLTVNALGLNRLSSGDGAQNTEKTVCAFPY